MKNNLQANTGNLIQPLIVLLLAVTGWYLVDIAVVNTEGFSTTLNWLFKTGIVISALVSVLLTINQARTPANPTFAKIQGILEDVTDDPAEIRKAIIRLKQVTDPQSMTLAIGLATLLESLLNSLEKIQSEQQIQEKENLDLNKTASELKQKHDLLVNKPNLKSEFLSRMGDEITSPMKSLSTMLKLLNNMEFEPEQRDLLVIANHSAHSLIENLTNILEFSKLDADLYNLENDRFNLRETISSVLETQESIALAKSLIIETDIKADVPEHIFSSQKSMIKVLDNLISNAIRFTDRGQIQLVVDNLSDENKQLIRLTVIDTGIGIPQSAIEGLFDSLAKDTELVNSSFAGRLRLIVSKKLCEQMGGEIGVRSIEGQGSQFWFTIDISEQKITINE